MSLPFRLRPKGLGTVIWIPLFLKGMMGKSVLPRTVRYRTVLYGTLLHLTLTRRW